MLRRIDPSDPATERELSRTTPFPLASDQVDQEVRKTVLSLSQDLLAYVEGRFRSRLYVANGLRLL